MKTVAKAIKVLKCFTPEHEEWGISELGRATGINKVIVHRLLRSLAAEQFVVQDPVTKRYRLGSGIIELARHSLRDVNVADVARPHLERLREQTNETVLLVVRRGSMVVVAEPFESRQIVRVSASVGDQNPMYYAATGKLFLTFGPPSLLENLLKTKLKRCTPNTLTTAAEITKELALTRKRGWAVDDEEAVLGVRAVAAPVFGHDGEIEACIAVRAPAARLPRSSQATVAARIIAAADAIAAELQRRPKH